MQKVLIIDDYLTIRKAIKLRFRIKYGDNVKMYEAGDLGEALNLIKSHKFDYIISDLRLPDSEQLNTIKVLTPLVDMKKLTWVSSSGLEVDGMIKKDYDFIAPIIKRFEECQI